MCRICTLRLPPWTRIALFAFVLGVSGLAGRAGAQAPISAARYFPPQGYRPKEFTLVRDGGWFHLFYIRENRIANGPTERSLGHARSRDLYIWAEQDTILPVIEGTYEGTQIWAPHLVKIGGLWHLFYPAMRDEPQLGYHLAQSITEATSPDLYQWTRRETPLFDNSIFSWAYYDTTVDLGRDCRDPFVWWDATRSEWLMYVTTRPASRPESQVIGIAGSSDLEHWSDRGYLPFTLPEVSFSDVAESPTILTRDGSLLMFMWTTNAGQSLTYSTSTDAVTGWGSPRRLRAMLNNSTVGWWASETLTDGPRTYFGTVHDVWINFWDQNWTGPDTFTLSFPNPGQVFSASFDRADALPGDSANVAVEAHYANGRRVGLTYVRVRGDVSDTLVATDWGFPDSLTLVGDSTATPLVVPEGLGDGRTCLLTVSASGAGATAPPDTLYIGKRPPVYDNPPPEPPDPVIHPIRPTWLPRLKQLQFVSDHPLEAWEVQVFDVRGRLRWSDRAERGQRMLVWSVGRPGIFGSVAPGIYFARVRAGSGAPQRFKIPLFGGP